MEKSFLLCFFIMSGLTAMEVVRLSKANFDEEVLPRFGEYFELNNPGMPKISEENFKSISAYWFDMNDFVPKTAQQSLLKCIAIGREEGKKAGFEEGKAAVNQYYQSLYDSNPKKVGLAVLGIIIVGSVIYTGTKLFYFGKRKFKNWRNDNKKS